MSTEVVVRTCGYIFDDEGGVFLIPGHASRCGERADDGGNVASRGQNGLQQASSFDFDGVVALNFDDGVLGRLLDQSIGPFY